MIIGISGKIGSGKDTAAIILRRLYLEATCKGLVSLQGDGVKSFIDLEREMFIIDPNCEIKKFAAKLKQFVSIATGCKIEDLEDQEFKSKGIGEEWKYFDSAINPHIVTYRQMLQILGTEVCRSIHYDFWVNALFADYKAINLDKRASLSHVIDYKDCFPIWIISDVRFPNEVQAIKDRGGIIIRLQRGINPSVNEHISETALDNYSGYDHIIDNNGTLEELYNSLKSLNLFANV